MDQLASEPSLFFLFQDRGGADDVEGRGFASGWLKGDAHRQTLPFGRLADRNEVIYLWPWADLLQDNGTSRSELGDYGEEAAFGCRGDAAVSRVVAEPDHVRDGSVEIRQMQRGNVAGDTVDREPGAWLPDPVGCCVGRQGVVEAKSAANGEGAISDLVNLSGDPLFLAVVDEERADFEARSLVGFRVGSGVRLGIRHLAIRAKGDSVDLGSCCEQRLGWAGSV